ncbi:MAG: MucB/RseB C-terminal domain-containing protein [Pseudomonadota bacterium]
MKSSSCQWAGPAGWVIWFGMALSCLTAIADEDAPRQSADALLQRISDAVNSMNYRGTLIRSVDGRINSMLVIHSNDDGLVRERLVAMDGEGREIIRVGDELICLYPNRRVKLIETNATPSNAFVRLPAVLSDLNRFYQIEARGRDRIANRRALKYLVRPRDAYRYGHQLWVDEKTMLPLKMQLLSRSRVIEEIRFSDIEIGIEIPEQAFVSEIDSSEFRVIRAGTMPNTMRPTSTETLTAAPASATEMSGGEWPAEASPGFRLRAKQTSVVTINGQVTQRMVFSDGLATVSVFIGSRPSGDNAQSERRTSQTARMGAAHSYQRQVGNKTVTLVGEVPVETLQMLAEQAERQMLGKPVDSENTR